MKIVLAASAIGSLGQAPPPLDAPDVPDARAIASIRYETGPCLGNCPVYRVTLRADGRGTFEGRYATAAPGKHEFTLPPERFRALAAHLAAIRPDRDMAGDYMGSGANRRCRHVGDLPSYELVWTEPDGDRQSLCHFSARALGEDAVIGARMRAIPELISILGFIGRH